ncbi:metal-dependent hydrolase [Corticibacter populi]|uniref:Metal-dependent hydrolase n=1 Tax=Corticibacter populi TaxID=1550736 RepID=A0A3M6QPE1_9BURK|nr:metal-dependent hydrolase [Corticibacter populi]RMX04907.1 metal-dependent hydrolase [Corticibacter populi]RZS33669.1 inner membrane protein [Corticibacter populi]
MPTIFTHVAVPLAAKVALGARVPASMLLMGMLASVLPDFDGIPNQFGMRLDGIWGHRGFTHSIGFAFAVGCIGLGFARRWGIAMWKAWLWMFVCCFSHPLLDACTTGRYGVPLLWPFSDARYVSAWQFILVSPVNWQRFFSARGLATLQNEFFTVWLPLMGAALLVLLGRKLR